MQDDLTDAVQWAVDQGIADPKRVAIYGGSYGMSAACWFVYTHRPEQFCTGRSGLAMGYCCSTHTHSLSDKAMEGIDITLVTCRSACADVYCECNKMQRSRL